jgi:molybdate transport system ATP-binding protein
MIQIEIKKELKEFELDASLGFGKELAVLTGANGSGKSTLLRCIAGLERPQRGSVKINNRVVFDIDTDVPPEGRNIGYVCQESALFPWLTVKKNITFGLSKEVQADKKVWINHLYSELELEHLLKRNPQEISGGERQRVALARAIAPRPELLLLDEPFSAVDVHLRPVLRRFLKDLQKDWKVPILMVTHDHAEAYVMADRLFEIIDGRITIIQERGNVIQMPLISY